MHQVARKILGVAVLGAAFASAGAGVASADTLGSVTKSPAAKAVHGDDTAAAVKGAVNRADKNVLQKNGRTIGVNGPVSESLGGAPRI